MSARIARLPLILILAGIASFAMFVPAMHAVLNEDHSVARSFLYSGIVGLAVVSLIGIAMSTGPRPRARTAPAPRRPAPARRWR